MKYLTLMIAALGAIGTLGIMLTTASTPDDTFDLMFQLGFFIWAILPFMALITLTLVIFRGRSQAAQTAIFFTTAVITALSVWIYWTSIFASTSSTSALVFIFVPLYSLAAIAIVFGFSWLILRSFIPSSKA
jgi:hypothetical protein